MSAAPIASGARTALPMTAQPTVKTSPNVPMNSVTYLRMCDPSLGEQLWLTPARVGETRMPAPAAWRAVAEVAGSRVDGAVVAHGRHGGGPRSGSLAPEEGQ